MTDVYGFRTMNHDDMKRAYKRLALKYHPDVNKDADALEQMKQVNIEFAYWYSRAATNFVREEKTSKAETDGKREYYQNHYAEAFMASLDEMIRWLYSERIDRLDGITVDLVGVFVWIAGIKATDRELQQKIKAVGFQGSYKYHDDGSREYMWKWTPAIKRFNSNPNIDDIKRTYGSRDMTRKYKLGS